MKRFLMLVVAGVLVGLPRTAAADGFLSPNVGVNFGGATTKETVAFGGSLGVIGNSAGFEFDVNYSPELFVEDALDADGHVVTVMGNVLIGGRTLYFAVGAGLIRTNVSSLGNLVDLDLAKNSFGGNVGGGFFAGGGSVAFRGDVRYFRAFNTDEELEDLFDADLSFWRGSVGIGFMW